MTRQYKTMREELLIKINTLEEKCTQLQDKVGATRQVYSMVPDLRFHHLIDRVLCLVAIRLCFLAHQSKRRARLPRASAATIRRCSSRTLKSLNTGKRWTIWQWNSRKCSN